MMTTRQEHVWEYDGPASFGMNRAGGDEFSFRYGVSRCTTCGCIRITDSQTFQTKYKPAEWTWNPLKTLTEEPPCPATW